MPLNSETIIYGIRRELEMLWEYVTGASARTVTADPIERGMFRWLLQLGAQLLLLFFVSRAQHSTREAITRPNGQVLPYHSEKKRTYYSVFGKLPLSDTDLSAGLSHLEKTAEL